jgi:RNA polymerase sigma-70 factor (sigma-E family)
VETLDESSPVPADETGETAVAALFRARYLDMVRLAVLLGADDAEDIAQEAFARLLTRHAALRDPTAALAYVRSTVCNLTRKRWRHSLVVRSRTLAMPDEASPEHTAILHEDHREVLAALASLPARKREAIVLRYWLDLSDGEIAAVMGVSAGTVKSQLSKGMGSLGRALEALA